MATCTSDVNILACLMYTKGQLTQARSWCVPENFWESEKIKLVITRPHCSLVTILTRLQMGRILFNSRQEEKILLWRKDRLWCTPKFVRDGYEGSYSRGKTEVASGWPFPCTTHIKNAWSYISNPECVFMFCFVITRKG